MTEERLSEPGTYPAKIVRVDLGESRNGAIEARILYSTDAGSIMGFHYLTKINGERNDRCVEALEQIGWDTGLLVDLPRCLANKPCQIKVEEEEYQGEIRLRVPFVNPPGGGRSLSPEKLDKLQSVFDGKTPSSKDPEPVPESDVPF